MRRAAIIFALFMAATTAGSPVVYPQTGRVVDRIVARIEDDIILQSQVREAGSFQKLIEGHAEGDDRLLAELIEQWVVENEATASHFPQPAQPEVDREMARLTDQLGGPAAFAARLREQSLSAAEVRQILIRQIYVERYVDSKFRPSVQIESADIANYYRNELLPELQKKNQPVPRLAEVEEQIRELLTQRAITDLAAKWLDETKSHLKIELKSSDAKLGA
jgi:hypothetical protein